MSSVGPTSIVTGMDAVESDRLTPFLLEESGLRGVLVRLGPAWREIRSHLRGPEALGRLLGEAVAASALLTAHIKRGTRLSLQLTSSGPLRTLVADCSGEGELRGLARFREPLPEPLALDALGRDALLAVCLEEPGGQRYQGLVPLEAGRLDLALEDYFARSEQIATRIRLVADASQAAGMMLQALPADASRYDPAPEDFQRLGEPLGRLRPDLLLATAAPEHLLESLFPGLALRLFRSRELRFGCGCSREKAAAMLRLLGAAETAAALAGRPFLEVSCEFCGRDYLFTGPELAEIHHGEPPTPPTRH